MAEDAKVQRGREAAGERGRPAPQKTGKGASTRDPLLDNARAILITLVVVGHAIESMDTALSNTLYTWIYSFHMPAFVVISGYLSRSYRNDPRQVSRLLTGLVLPYLIFQVLHSIEQDLLNGRDIAFTLWNPAWTLWFLLALTAWRLATPALRALRHPLVFAVIISVIAPLDADLDTTLSWGRILSFLPFFTLGLMFTPERIDALRRMRHARLLGSGTLVGALVVAALTHESFSTSIFTMSLSYASRDMTMPYGLATRLLALAAGAALTLALLMITPRGKYWFTAIGARSLTVYLVHSMVIELPRQLDWFVDLSGTGSTLLVILGAILLTLLLSSAPVTKGLSWLTSPPIGHLLVREEEFPGRERGSSDIPAERPGTPNR